ncbi:MAG: hypothetical protein AAB384_01805 [Patescibacteria group bacterium]
MSIALLQHVVQLLLVEAITGPVWWYTGGLAFMLRWMRERSARTWYRLAISLWMRNIMVPMFGQYDWQGRIISFFIRLFQVIARCIVFGFAAVWYAVVVLLWCVAPLAVLYFIFAPLFL